MFEREKLTPEPAKSEEKQNERSVFGLGMSYGIKKAHSPGLMKKAGRMCFARFIRCGFLLSGSQHCAFG